jgi:hypothetical protein
MFRALTTSTSTLCQQWVRRSAPASLLAVRLQTTDGMYGGSAPRCCRSVQVQVQVQVLVVRLAHSSNRTRMRAALVVYVCVFWFLGFDC